MNEKQVTHSLRLVDLSDAEALSGLVTELGYPTSPVEVRSRLQVILEDVDYRTIIALVGERVVGFVGTRLGSV